MNIPFVDLKNQYQNIKEDIDRVLQNVINDTAFIKGKYVKNFELEYEKLYGVRNCISCANGTDAIYISLKALGVGPGDEVITVSNTWISTAETISQAGAKPVFVDIHPEYYTIDLTKVEERITSRTKALIVVHLFGQPVDMDAAKRIADKHGLFLIEDCAQSHFAQWKGVNVGTFGIAGTFSFFPGKNLGAYGDAGGIVSNDDEFARKARMFANHGALVKHQHEIEGINSRLDGLQAAILSVKLKHILNWNERRIEHAKEYNRKLADIPQVVTPKMISGGKHVFHLYVVRVERREEIQSYLKEKGISTGIHYPTPLPFLKAYDYLGYSRDDFPVSADYQDKILSLPMYPELTSPQIEFVTESIKECYR